MAEHNTLTGSQLHEPKGVDTAALDTVYVANGTGSGAWQNISTATGSAVAGSVLHADGAGAGSFIRYQGWGQYQDTDRTVGTPSQTLTAGVRTLWTCDGGNATIEKLPSDSAAPLWDVSTNKHVPISEFDTYNLRLTFTAENYAGAAPYIEVEIDIGGSIGVIHTDSRSLRKGGAAQSLGFSLPLYTGPTYFANGGSIYVTYQGTGTCDIYKNDILIVRESKNYV